MEKCSTCRSRKFSGTRLWQPIELSDFPQKIALLLYPRFVEIEHNGISAFVDIGDISHKRWIYWVALVAFS